MMDYSNSLDNLVTDDDVIREAEAISEMPIGELRYRGDKFADELSAALYTLSMNGFDDDIIQDNHAGGFVTRIGRYVLLCDGTGFVNTRTYDKVHQAVWAMDDIRRDMNDPYQ